MPARRRGRRPREKNASAGRGHGLTRFSANDLVTFLRAVDDNLESPQEIMVLGGGALALAYDDSQRTTDIDLWNSASPSLRKACEAARASTKLPVLLSTAGVSDMPYEAEDRLQTILPELHHLTVLVFDVYDIALSKTVRGERKDLDALRALHERHPLEEEVLVERYFNEMDHVIGDPQRIAQNFLNLIDHLYGRVTAEDVGRRLHEEKSPRPPRAAKRRSS